MPEPHYRRLLREIFENRKRNNPRYSLRAFARDLRMQPPTLSHVLNGHRRLPASRVEDIADGLGLSAEQRGEFLSSLESDLNAGNA